MSGYSAIPPYRPFEWKLSEMKQKYVVNQMMTIKDSAKHKIMSLQVDHSLFTDLKIKS